MAAIFGMKHQLTLRETDRDPTFSRVGLCKPPRCRQWVLSGYIHRESGLGGIGMVWLYPHNMETSSVAICTGFPHALL